MVESLLENGFNAEALALAIEKLNAPLSAEMVERVARVEALLVERAQAKETPA